MGNTKTKLVVPDEPYACNMLIVGEMPHELDADSTAFSQSNLHGQDLAKLIDRAGLYWHKIARTNVFSEKAWPTSISVEDYFDSALDPAAVKSMEFAPFDFNGHCWWPKPQFAPELRRLASEVHLVQPRFILAVGRTATWAINTLFAREDERHEKREMHEFFDFVLQSTQHMVHVLPIPHPAYYRHLAAALNKHSRLNLASIEHAHARTVACIKGQFQLAEQRAASAAWKPPVEPIEGAKDATD